MSSSKKAAPKDALEELHNALANALAERIKSGDATAADLGVARQFLKDNGIDCIPRKDNPLGKLADALPFPSQDAIGDEDNDNRSLN